MTERWSDLRVRLASACVLVALATAAALAGEPAFALLSAALVGFTLWELSRMHDPARSVLPYMLAALGAVLCVPHWVVTGPAAPSDPVLLSQALSAMGVACLAMLLHRRDPLIMGVYALATIGAGYAVIWLYRDPQWLLLLLGTVIATDLAGYFVGKSLGGPKFWPRLSPKKTWSGVVGGWLAAGVFATALRLFLGLELVVIALAVVMSFCSQLGDIAESLMKRRAGVKDASNLIPGHGGFLDRFDGVIGAILPLMVGLMVLDL